VLNLCIFCIGWPRSAVQILSESVGWLCAAIDGFAIKGLLEVKEKVFSK